MQRMNGALRTEALGGGNSPALAIFTVALVVVMIVVIVINVRRKGK